LTHPLHPWPSRNATVRGRRSKPLKSHGPTSDEEPKFDADASWRARLLKGANDVKFNMFNTFERLDKAREAKKLEKAIKKAMREKGIANECLYR